MDGIIETSAVTRLDASGAACGPAPLHDVDAVLAGFDALSMPLLVCDRMAQVVAKSKQAERLLDDATLVHLSGQRLRAVCRACDEDLADGLRRAANLTPPALSTTLLRAKDWSEVARAEIAALPGSNGLVCVAVIRRTHTDAKHLLIRLGLTAAEVEVCACLVGGAPLSAIATSRDVGAETIRSQAKSIYAKLGVRGQSELAARFVGML
jgi:DNA-binding CsgD family transcriptional regulator